MRIYQQFYPFNLKIKAFSLFLLLLFLASCSQEAQKKVPGGYFNLTDFIQKEAERLQKDSIGITKTVLLNGKEETKQMPVSNWQEELNAFVEADISKKSFMGKYSEEVLKEDTQLTTRYTAKEEGLRTKSLSVTFGNDGTPVKIRAVLFTSNVLYSAHQQLTYERNHGFWISGTQNIEFLDPDTFSVAAIFQP